MCRKTKLQIWTFQKFAVSLGETTYLVECLPSMDKALGLVASICIKEICWLMPVVLAFRR